MSHPGALNEGHVGGGGVGRLYVICEVLRHPLCKGGHETDGIHGGLVIAHGRIRGSWIQ